MTIHFQFTNYSDMYYLGASRTKSTCTPLRLFKETNFLYIGCLTPLKNKLCDALTPLYLKVFVSMIEKNDFDFTRVVGINNTRTNLDTMFHSETRSWRNTPIDTRWQYNGYTRPDKSAVCRWNNNFISAVKIVSNSTPRTTSWNNSIVGKLLNTKAHLYFRWVSCLYQLLPVKHVVVLD